MGYGTFCLTDVNENSLGNDWSIWIYIEKKKHFGISLEKSFPDHEKDDDQQYAPPTCVYLCLRLHKLLTSCSTGIGSWYNKKYLEKNEKSWWGNEFESKTIQWYELRGI